MTSFSDFERGFIKAEVCGYDDYKAITTKPRDAEVKAAGKYRQEGKNYIMADKRARRNMAIVRRDETPGEIPRYR